MVSNIEIYPLIRAIWNLASVSHRAGIATSLTPAQINVKGEKGIIDSLGAIYDVINRLSKKYEEIFNIPNEIQKWINLLEKEYGDPEKFLQTKSVGLFRKHAVLLYKDTLRWFEQIYSIYEKSNTKLINEKTLREMVVELSKVLDNQTKKDLRDGYECLVNNIPTPAVMILYRLGESMVKKFYKKEMGYEPTESSTMGTMARDLREKQAKEIEQKIRTKPDPLVNYIASQTEERNLAQHPGGRYTQTEAEEVFILVKKIIEDIHERLEEKSSELSI